MSQPIFKVKKQPEISPENGHGQPPAVLLPRCQYCGAGEEHGAPIVAAFMDLAGAQAVVTMCGSCRSVFAVQIMSIPRPAPSPIIAP